MSNVIEIYEFSRAFDNVTYSEPSQRWVSGGYAPEKFYRESKNIPPRLRDTVASGYFSLNDSYPPADGKVALLGGEIASYSLLAVANGQLDDGGRPTIGYRYFWLEKPVDGSDVDGVGTLLWWWHTHKKPVFDMGRSNANELSKADQLVKADQLIRRSVHPAVAAQSKVRALIADQQLPQTKVVNEIDLFLDAKYPNSVQCHFLAYLLALDTGQPLSWAWNVRRLVNPENFISIYAATERDIPPVSKTAIEFYTSGNSKSEKKKAPQQTTSFEVSLKTIESRFSSGRSLKNTGQLDELLQYLADPYSINIDSKLYDGSPIYRALVALRSVDETELWLEELLSIDLDSSEMQRGFELHRQLVDIVYTDRSSAQYHTLQSTLSKSISGLFLAFVDGGTKKEEDKKMSYRLTALSDCWEPAFHEYDTELKHFLLCQLSQSEEVDIVGGDDPFYQRILALVEKVRADLGNRIKIGKDQRFYLLAELFNQSKNYNTLPQVFRYLSRGNIRDISDSSLYGLFEPQIPKAEADINTVDDASDSDESRRQINPSDELLGPVLALIDILLTVSAMIVWSYGQPLPIAIALIIVSLGFSFANFRIHTPNSESIRIFVLSLLTIKALVLAFMLK